MSIAVFAVFRTGTQAYRASFRETDTLQRVRYVMDYFERDLLSIYYLDEDEYNEQLRDRIEEYQSSYLQAVDDGDLDSFADEWGADCDEEGRENDIDCQDNPFEKPLLDLTFQGTDGGDLDSIKFSIRQPQTLGQPYRPWGLVNVTYTVDSGFLIRRDETATIDPREWNGEEYVAVAKGEDEVDYSIVASGVKVFDLSYAYWWDHQWFETDNWTSNTKSIRNSETLLGDYEFDEDDPRFSNPTPGTEGFDDWINEQENLPDDGIPTYLRLRLEIADPENEARTMKMSRIYRLPYALESWTPNEELDEDERDMEYDMRDEQTVKVFPGAMRKR